MIDGDMDNVQPEFKSEFGTREWAHEYKAYWGVFPMAGAENEAEGGGVEGEAEGDTSDEGQGDSPGLYDLSTVPDAYRGEVEAILKSIEGNVTKKFQEAAEYRKQWEPFESLNLTEQDPEQLANLLAFAEIANDQELFQEWWEKVGEEYGFAGSSDESDDDDLFDGEDDDGDMSDEEAAQALGEIFEQMLEERLNPIQEQLSQREHQELVQEVENEIEETLGKLEEQYGEFDVETVLKFALAHEDEDDPITAGFMDYQGLLAKTETGVLSGKNNGSTSLPPGTPDTNAKMPTTFDEAGEMAAARIRAANTV